MSLNGIFEKREKRNAPQAKKIFWTGFLWAKILVKRVDSFLSQIDSLLSRFFE